MGRPPNDDAGGLDACVLPWRARLEPRNRAPPRQHSPRASLDSPPAGPLTRRPPSCSYNQTAVQRGLLGLLHTPQEALAHPYFQPYVAAAAALSSPADHDAAPPLQPTRSPPRPPPHPAAAAVFTHPSGGGGGVSGSAPSSLIAGEGGCSMVGGGGGGGGGHHAAPSPPALPVGLTSPARGGAVGVPLTLPLSHAGAVAVAAAAAHGYTLNAGSSTAREPAGRDHLHGGRGGGGGGGGGAAPPLNPGGRS